MKALEQYLRDTQAVQYFLEVTKREDGKPIEFTIAPYGIPATPLSGKFPVEKEAESKSTEK